MTDLRQAAQQALEALTLSIPKPRPADDDYAELGWKEHNAAIAALRAALAEPEPDFSGIDRQAVLTALLPDIEKLFGLKYEKDAMAKTLEVTPAQMVHADAVAEPEQEPVRLQCTTCGTVYADGVPPQVPEQEPQTTHWEGCEAVHPECKEKNK